MNIRYKSEEFKQQIRRSKLNDIFNKKRIIIMDSDKIDINGQLILNDQNKDVKQFLINIRIMC